jgi:hypothetical protein
MSSVVRASLLGMGLLLGFCVLSPAQAETTEPQAPLSTATPESNNDPFSSRGDNNGAIMQLIHRAMRGDANVDRAAESAAQRENLSEAASDFFAKRNQRLKKSPDVPIGQPAVTNAPASLKPAMVNPIVQPATPASEVPSAELTVPQPVKP